MKQLNLTSIESKQVFTMAFRYALSRKTYVTFDMVRMLTRNWPGFRDDEKEMFKKEIKEAIARGGAGMQMDVEEWKKILEL